MHRLVVTGLILFAILAATPQSPVPRQKASPRRVPGASKPKCAQSAICFSGEINEGQTFRRRVNKDLEFVFTLPGSFQVEITHAEASCRRLFWVADPPFRAHHVTEIDAGYDWTAEDEVQTSPREFRFATSCKAYRTLFKLSETDAGEYLANFKSLANGEGLLWITESRVTHSHSIVSEEHGAVEWMRFSVEIKLPRAK